MAAFCATWNPRTQAACPLVADPVDRLSALLDEHVAGQHLATRAIRKAVAKNIRQHKSHSEGPHSVVEGVADILLSFPYSTEVRKKHKEADSLEKSTLLMHFSGPTGVGKTLSSKLIGEALFSEKNPEQRVCGHMELNLRQADEALGAEKALSGIRDQVAEQLSWCPRSVLVFDEIQSVAESLVDGIISIFDSPTHSILYKGKTVATNHAVVILVSDLGSRKLHSSMDRTQARTAVEEAATARFIRSKKRVLLQNIVPFLPLSLPEMAAVAELELKKLTHILEVEFRGMWSGLLTWSNQVPEEMARQCIAEQTCFDDGGRGVETAVQNEVQGRVEETLAELISEASAENTSALLFNNVHLSYPVPGAGVTVAVDEVFRETEFREWASEPNKNDGGQGKAEEAQEKSEGGQEKKAQGGQGKSEGGQEEEEEGGEGGQKGEL